MLFDTEQPSETDSTAATAAAAPAATATTAEEHSTEQTGNELDNQLPDPDEAEDEFEGVKLRGPKAVLDRLKSERLMQRDYTQKTQTLADERRALEAERETHQQSAKMGEQMQQERHQLFMVDSRLKQLAQVNLQQLSAQNPDAATQLRDEFMRLQAARPALVDSIRGKESHLQQAEQRSNATLAQKALDYLSRELKDWSPEKDRELESYAKGEGLDTQQLSQYMLRNPQIMRVLNKASQYDKLMKQRATKPAPKPPEPASRVGGAAATTTKTPSDMSTAEYAEWRAKRRQR